MKKETKKTTTKVEEPKFELIRLNKFLSHNSNYSRREADKLIEEGKIRVNNKVVTDLATKVKSTDKVEIGKKLIKEENLGEFEKIKEDIVKELENVQGGAN